MAENTHTPGPWWSEGEYDEEQFGCAVIAANTDCGPLPGNPTRGMVAWASELLADKAEECIANARLIAAAPDMLQALRNIAEGNLGDDPWQANYERIRQVAKEAIAATEGRS